MAWWAAKKLHAAPSDIIWKLPLSQLFLFLREDQFEATEGKCITLSDKEMIDRLNENKNIG